MKGTFIFEMGFVIVPGAKAFRKLHKILDYIKVRYNISDNCRTKREEGGARGGKKGEVKKSHNSQEG